MIPVWCKGSRGDGRSISRGAHLLGLARLMILLTVGVAGTGIGATPATAAVVGLSVQSSADPTNFSPNDERTCIQDERCDRYQVTIRNVGDTVSSGPIEVTDVLPAGITTTGKENPGQAVEGIGWECAAPIERSEKVSVVKCSNSEPIGPEQYLPVLSIPTTAPSVGGAAVETNTVEVTGGGTASATTTTNRTVVSGLVPPFELTSFDVKPISVGGATDTLAGGHPNDVTASLGVSNVFQPSGVEGEATTQTEPVENLRSVIVELPLGLVGNPQALPRCPEHDLVLRSQGPEALKSACPPGSRIGVVAFNGEGNVRLSNEETGSSALYNMEPQAGYPAVFAFAFAEKVITMYATVVHTSSGYRLRVSAPGVPEAVAIVGASLTFFGNPAEMDSTPGPHQAFLTNPADCSPAEATEGLLRTKVEADSWENPGRWVTAESESYPEITGCNLLQFQPKFEMAPSPAAEEGTSQADEPSGYSVDLRVPQTSLFEETATPELKDATVALPEGISVSPSAADGLVGCQERGPNGIDIPESKSGHEAGEGETIGPDGLPHMTAGHCPDASTLGTVEIITPLLEEPLKGHVFLAQPKCGGEGQPACTEASATNGELYGLYIEAEDHAAGVIVKLPGSVSINPATGQITTTFRENPQVPFSELKLHLHGGARAPLANPQACGSFATSSTLTSWGGQEASGPSPSFGVDWDGKGGACPAGLPFAPGFSAGTTSPAAGAFSPFVLAFSRNDREQDLSGLSVTLPQGLLARIAGIPQCGEAEANAGTCGPESQLGTASALAGSGGHPFSVTGGRVYLTGGYKNQPFGLSIVVPAVAGPFNLGNVVVRASIHIDPSTGQATVTSDPLPQSRDGVPFRLRTVVTEINRPGFTFNPTNCAQQQIAATITGAQGASAGVSSPFAATGCAGLPFRPSFSVSTSGRTSKANGASLVVNVTQKPGEANIHKVDVQLPLALPARLTTLQKACTQAQFAANPAGCPAGAFIGTATATTPVLDVPLSGPAILVSHGGAAFPDVEFVLQGEGVTIVLDGATDIKKGITYSRFETVPDAPISSFQTILPEGPHSALAANGNLCHTTKTVSVRRRVTIRVHGHARRVTKTVKKAIPAPLLVPTTITGQNGAVTTQSTKVTVTECAKAKKAPRAKSTKHKKKHKKKH